MTTPSAPLTFTRGPAMANRMMLAPLTNLQSHPDGTLSDDEIRWLTMRAQGGMGLVMTAAAHVQRQGQGFPGQLGIWSDDHLPRLTQLADAIRAGGALSAVQLHHAGIRSPKDLIGEAPQGPYADEATGSRALTTAEVEHLRDDFIAAAVRAERAGFDGVEIHGAHGYVLAQFLDADNNQRTDGYGGDFAGRARIIREVIDGVRAATRPDFQVGLRLSPERFGIRMAEALELAQSVMTGGQLDYLDMSLWDCFKTPEEPEFADKPLIHHFTALERGEHPAGRGRQDHGRGQSAGLPRCRGGFRPDRARRDPAPRFRGTGSGRSDLCQHPHAGHAGAPRRRRAGRRVPELHGDVEGLCRGLNLLSPSPAGEGDALSTCPRRTCSTARSSRPSPARSPRSPRRHR